MKTLQILTDLDNSLISATVSDYKNRLKLHCIKWSLSFQFHLYSLLLYSFRFLAPGATWLFSKWMLHWWQVSGNTACELFACTH